jgi:Flp pilus assembly protein TadG
MKAHANSFAASVSAASAVEFALVLPLFLALIFGILTFGAHFAIVHGVQQLAAEAARVSIAGLSDSERATLAENYVADNAAFYPLLSPDHLSISAAASPSDADTFVVTVDYDASNLFVYALPHIVPMPSSHIERTAVIPRGGY